MKKIFFIFLCTSFLYNNCGKGAHSIMICNGVDNELKRVAAHAPVCFSDEDEPSVKEKIEGEINHHNKLKTRYGTAKSGAKAMTVGILSFMPFISKFFTSSKNGTSSELISSLRPSPTTSPAEQFTFWGAAGLVLIGYCGFRCFRHWETQHSQQAKDKAGIEVMEIEPGGKVDRKLRKDARVHTKGRTEVIGPKLFGAKEKQYTEPTKDNDFRTSKPVGNFLNMVKSRVNTIAKSYGNPTDPSITVQAGGFKVLEDGTVAVALQEKFAKSSHKKQILPYIAQIPLSDKSIWASNGAVVWADAQMNHTSEPILLYNVDLPRPAQQRKSENRTKFINPKPINEIEALITLYQDKLGKSPGLLTPHAIRKEIRIFDKQQRNAQVQEKMRKSVDRHVEIDAKHVNALTSSHLTLSKPAIKKTPQKRVTKVGSSLLSLSNGDSFADMSHLKDDSILSSQSSNSSLLFASTTSASSSSSSSSFSSTSSSSSSASTEDRGYGVWHSSSRLARIRNNDDEWNSRD